MTNAQKFWNTARKGRFGNRTAVIVATTIGFAVGAAGFAAAQSGPGADDSVSPSLIEVSETTVETTLDTVVDDSSTSTSIESTPTTSDDSTSTTVTAITVDLQVPGTTIDDSSSSSTTPTTIDDDDDTSSTTPNTIDDDDTSSTVPGNTVPDNSTAPTTAGSTPSTSVAPSLPAPFTETYNSAGGSITVSWSGTSFSLVSVSPSSGYQAEIEDNSWDRIRVDFDNDDNDHRIEVRLNDGSIRVRNS